MCVSVFPLHLSLLGSEFKSGWYCSVSAVDLSDCCVRSPRFRIFNFSYIFFHPASSKLAWLLFFLSTTQESPTRKDTGRAWTPTTVASPFLFSFWVEAQKLLLKFAAACWFIRGGFAEVQKAALSLPQSVFFSVQPRPSLGQMIEVPVVESVPSYLQRTVLRLHYSIFYQSSYRQSGFQSWPVSDTDPYVGFSK